MALSDNPAKRDAQLVRYKATKAGMSNDEYRDWLQGRFGKRSASELDAYERRIAHASLNRLLSKLNWREPQIEKLMAIWHALADAGVVHNRNRNAMQAWCHRQMPKVSALQWASSQQLQALIEALKGWAQRVGVELE